MTGITSAGRAIAAPAAPRAHDLPGIAALILVWLAATAWARPLMLPDEGRYVGVAWEMLRSGDWLTPTLDGLPYFHKPPLFYWITAGSMSIFGLNEWAARAAPILGAGLGAFSIYVFARRWCGVPGERNERLARLTLLALLLQPLFFIGGQFANLDMLVAGCITATIVLLADAALCIEHRLTYRRALAAAYAMAAIGVLAKGLIGLVLPALVVGAWLLLRRRWRVLGAMLWWPGALLFVALAAPWFVAMQQRFDGFFDYFFVVQHFKRYAAAGFNNAQPFWFFPAVLLLFSLPWLPWLARQARLVWQGPLANALETRTGSAPGAVRLLLVLWLALVVGFFSLPRSKLIGYVLPAVPPLAMLIADGYLATLAMPRRHPGWAARLWLAGTSIAALLSIGAVAVIALYPLNSSREFASVLQTRRTADQPVVMLGHYYFDLPFYAHLESPVTVVDDWSGPQIGLRDDWRKELADAGRFAPGKASRALVSPEALAARLCTSPVHWVIGGDDQVARFGFLDEAEPALRRRSTTLWRVDLAQPAVAKALRCAGTPNAAPPAR